MSVFINKNFNFLKILLIKTILRIAANFLFVNYYICINNCNSLPVIYWSETGDCVSRLILLP